MYLHKTNAKVDGNILTIQPIEKKDVDEYTCVAISQTGTANASIALDYNYEANKIAPPSASFSDRPKIIEIVKDGEDRYSNEVTLNCISSEFMSKHY